MIPYILVTGLSLLLFAATQFFYPRDPAHDPRERHFWSIMLFIFSMLLGLTIRTSYETQSRVDTVASVFNRLSSGQMEDMFQEMFVHFHKHFDHAQPVLNRWALEALNQLRTDMEAGVIAIPRDRAALEIGKVYPFARESIFATNVGGTKFYFGDATYVNNNLAAADRGVPVVRFYLYSAKQSVLLRKFDQARQVTIEEFYDEVRELNGILGSTYSAVIDVDKLNLDQHWDLLLLDNKFVARTQLSTNWDPIRAWASESAENLRDARSYLSLLMGQVDNRYVAMMPNKEVQLRFHNYERSQPTQEYELATNIAKEILATVAR